MTLKVPFPFPLFPLFLYSTMCDPVALACSLSSFWYHWPWANTGLTPWVGSWRNELLYTCSTPTHWVSSRVALGESMSGPWQLHYRVSQNVILSPMVFNIYMKLLGGTIMGIRTRCHWYTDDTQALFLSSIWVRWGCTSSGPEPGCNGRLNPQKMEVLWVVVLFPGIR